MAGSPRKNAGVALYERAIRQVEPPGRARPVVQPLPPEQAEVAADAHAAAVEAFAEMLGVDDVLQAEDGDAVERVERSDARRIAKRYALAHLLADAIRVLFTMPVLQADHAQAIVNTLAALNGVKTF